MPSTRRHSASDLEILTFNANGARSSRVFLSRAFLSSLPQISFELGTDQNFPELPANGTRVSGVDLDTLIHIVYPEDPAAVAVAICRDGYTSPFSRQAIDDHHAILAVTMDGVTPHTWASRHHTYDPTPYFITYRDFVSSFHILSHEDRPQHPAEIIRIKVFPAAQLFSAITPPNADQIPFDSPILQGFQIAQQNCFRCHNSGETGGTKAKRSWQHLGEVAKARPEFFAAWVRNPLSIDSHAKMPPNLKYDQATLKVLTRYFQTFAP